MRHIDDMDYAVLSHLGSLLAARNDLDREIAAVIGRPMTAGHLGEYIASKVFAIDLEPSASATAIDGRFTEGPLAGKTVNVKWYLKREGMLDLTNSDLLDYYLVLSGPASSASSSRGNVRPWVIASVYLFDARELGDDLLTRGRRVGVASSVRAEAWAAAEVYPKQHSSLPLSSSQVDALRLFGSD